MAEGVTEMKVKWPNVFTSKLSEMGGRNEDLMKQMSNEVDKEIDTILK